MKKSRQKLLLGIWLLGMMGAISTVQAQKSKDVTEEIQARNNLIMMILESGDLDAMEVFYTKDAKAFPPNTEIIQGWENIRETWVEFIGPDAPSILLTTLAAEALGKTAIEEGAYQVKIPDGQVVDKGKYIVIWKKVDGEWLMHQDIYNSDLPVSQ